MTRRVALTPDSPRPGVVGGVAAWCRSCAGAARRWLGTTRGKALLGIAVVAGLVIAAFAVVGVPHVLGSKPIDLNLGSSGSGTTPVGSPRFEETFELVTGTGFSAGNQVEILSNGDETFPRLLGDLWGAKHSITVQMYYAAEGAVMDSILAVLAARSRGGVRVMFLYDAFGSSALSGWYLDSLQAAGVETTAFRPIRWYALDRAYHRSHARGIVIDGAIGYTGGMGFDDKWLGNGRRPGAWRETNVRFTGPSVLAAQASFVNKWAEATGVVLTGDEVLVRHGGGPPGGVRAAFLHSPPSIGGTVAERMLVLAIGTARHTLWITNPYFVPSQMMVRGLALAATRGVDVRILTNGETSDVTVTWLAGRSQYAALLAAGVRIFEYQAGVLHAKTFVIDGMWSIVGTMNFDNRSLTFNNEVALATLDSTLAGQMEREFLVDLTFAEEILPERFAGRSRKSRWLEAAAYLISRVL